MPSNIDELYEGLPDDAGLFERNGWTLKTRSYKGKRIPMWVKPGPSGEKKRKATDDDMHDFNSWKSALITEAEIENEPDSEGEEEDQEETEEVPMIAFAEDGRAVEIWGEMVGAKPIEVKDEEGELSHVVLQVKVKDLAGDSHIFDVPKGGVAAILSIHDAGKWSRSAREFSR